MSYRGWIFAALCLAQTPALAVQSFAVTREELALMPPYCTALYGESVGLPNRANSPLRDTVPAGCPSLHHYCDGLKAVIRADKNRAETGYWLGVAVEAFNSVVKDARWASCPVLPEAHVSLGKAMLRQGRATGTGSTQGVSQIVKAISLKPDYVPAYYALSDYYAGIGQKKKALEVVEDGLRQVPNSTGLLRRFTELGGKTPPAPLVEAVPPVAAPEPAEPEQQQAPPSEDQPASEPSTPPAAERAPQKIGTPSNPWCRFCPPE